MNGHILPLDSDPIKSSTYKKLEHRVLASCTSGSENNTLGREKNMIEFFYHGGVINEQGGKTKLYAGPGRGYSREDHPLSVPEA